MEAPDLPLTNLHSLCVDLCRNPFPLVPNPAGCKKRASVALIIRVQPTYPDDPINPSNGTDPSASTELRLSSFFSQSWVQRGDPEAFFIKRAARQGDRFTSHVALPGGKRDLEDADDVATSIRETSEEVGIDLSSSDVIYVGNLPERIVTAEWGTVPLMVLCPFVFLLTRNDVPPLKLQPTEVHSAHWVPLRALMAPSLRSHERADLSDRLTKQGGWLVRWLCRLLVGQMLFAATSLTPSESHFCSSTTVFLPPARPHRSSLLSSLLDRGNLSHGRPGSWPAHRPMLLWGLTHGIVADFLDLLPHFDVAAMWEWPTFSAPDIRLVTWLITWRFRRAKTMTIRPRSQLQSTFIVDEGFGALGREVSAARHAIAAEKQLSRASAVGHLLFGYFGLVKRAVYLTMLGRLGFMVLAGTWLLRHRGHRLIR